MIRKHCLVMGLMLAAVSAYAVDPSPPAELVKYITEARALGFKEDVIRDTVLTVGWPEDQVNKAMATAPAPAPAATTNVTPPVVAAPPAAAPPVVTPPVTMPPAAQTTAPQAGPPEVKTVPPAGAPTAPKFEVKAEAKPEIKAKPVPDALPAAQSTPAPETAPVAKAKPKAEMAASTIVNPAPVNPPPDAPAVNPKPVVTVAPPALASPGTTPDPAPSAKTPAVPSSVGEAKPTFTDPGISTPAPTEPAAGEAPNAAAPGPNRGPKDRGAPDDYQIGGGDVLHVSVWKEPEASVSGIVVRPDGKITVPLLKEVFVVGLTPTQAEEVIRKGLEKFINSPDVTVIISQINSKHVFIVGAVKKEGPLSYTYRMSIMQALSEAGGLTDYAKRKHIYVLRVKNGVSFQLPFDYDAALRGKRLELNIPLEPGDTLVVPH